LKKLPESSSFDYIRAVKNIILFIRQNKSINALENRVFFGRFGVEEFSKMKFTPNILEDIRSRVSITSVVGKHIQWDRRKSNPGKGDMWACCPFHNEKSPSFHVDERKGRYHCFGCKVSGDVFTFLVEKDGLTFPEAVEQLASEAGIKIAQQTPQEVERENRRLNLYDVMDLAAHFFQSQLHSGLGSAALGYLKRRGVNDLSIGEFGLGFAPNNKTALKEYLKSKNVSEADMIDAGLIISGDEIPTSYDRFRDRIIFPIHDAKGRTIAFGGRAMSPDAPAKYLNSPETPIFSKGQILYNFHRARSPSFEQNKILIVEGYLDVILLAQNKIRNVVAPLGTAVTEYQLEALWKVCPELILCFDGDIAGQKAANRAFDRALPYFNGAHSLSMAYLNGGQDPADMMCSSKLDDFLQILKDAIPASKYFWVRSTEGVSIDTPEQKSNLESTMQEHILRIRDENVQKHYRMETRLLLADLFFRHDRTVLKRTVRKPRSIPILSDSVAGSQTEIERTLLGLVVHFPGYYAESHQFFELRLLSPRLIEFKSELIRILVREGQKNIAAIYTSIHPDFVDVLEEVHGSAVRNSRFDGHIKFEKELGHNLFRRCPIARRPLPEPFAFKLFETILFMHLRTILFEDLRFAEQELAENVTEKNFARVSGLISELENVAAQIVNLERQLQEEGAEITANGRAESHSRAA
jgi:DNA primase